MQQRMSNSLSVVSLRGMLEVKDSFTLPNANKILTRGRNDLEVKVDAMMKSC